MCQQCLAEKKPSGVRLNLWNLPANQRCAVIGTCLEIEQLNQIRRRFEEQTRDVLIESDYDLHSYFVSICSDKNPIAQHLNKLLNRKFQHFVQQSHSLKCDDEIKSLWESIDRNDLRALAGYFWAFLIHKYSSQWLKNRLYGDIHMISHIAGQTHRKSQQLLSDQNRQLQQQLNKKEKLLESKNQTIACLQQQLKKPQQQPENPHQNITNNPVTELRGFQQKLLKRDRLINHLQQRLQRYEQQPEKPDTETAFVAESPQKNSQPCDQDCAHCSKTDLCGKRILYVGGFSRHRKKFQKLTEAINGEFLYHDGGKQQSEHQLSEMVKKSDAIFCPVDCISHSAIGRIKNLAKTQCKDCIFLKSASLSSFKHEVTRYAS